MLSRPRNGPAALSEGINSTCRIADLGTIDPLCLKCTAPMKVTVSFTIAIFAQLLGGCSVASFYSRPDTTDAERERDYRECAGIALRLHPESMETVITSVTTKCTTDKRGNQNCTSTPNSGTRDSNRAPRGEAENSCMRSRGYR